MQRHTLKIEDIFDVYKCRIVQNDKDLTIYFDSTGENLKDKMKVINLYFTDGASIAVYQDKEIIQKR